MLQFRDVPEGVANPVLEVDEVLLIFGHQVACVEIHVPFGEHVPQQLPLCQLLTPGIAEERGLCVDLGQEQTSFTW